MSVMQDEIYAVGYRRLPGDRPRRWAPWPIARTALALALRKRSTKITAGLCGMVFVVTGVFLVMQVIIGRLADTMGSGRGGAFVGGAAKAVVGDTHEALSTFIGTQTFTTAILLGIALGGIIADDRRTGAFELYFSRALSRKDYIVGKLLAVGLVPTATIVVPFLLLWIAAVGIAPGEIGMELVGLVVPGLIAAVLATVMLAMTLVGVSSIGERGRTIAVLYVAVFIVLASLGNGLAAAGYPEAGYLAPQRDLQTIADELLGVGGISMTASMLGLRNATNPSALISAAALIGYSAIGFSIFFARLRKHVSG